MRSLWRYTPPSDRLLLVMLALILLAATANIIVLVLTCGVEVTA